jgi:hypothetical protein
MYCQMVLAANNERLPPMWTPRRFISYLRWAWLVEGAAQYFSGQTALFRAAVITRLREGAKPSFPPSRRDAVILGGTVFDLLDRHAGPEACAMLVARLRREGPRGNLELSFDASLREIERAWREQLDEILYPQSEGLEEDSLSEALARTQTRLRPEDDLDVATPPELDLGSPPEFRFDNGPSGGRLPEEPDEQGGERHGDDETRRQPRRRSDPRQ